MRSPRWSFRDLKNAGITDSIILICVVMLVCGTVVPAVSRALLFYAPLAFSQPWRFISSAFLHSGFWHCAFNMISLYLLGDQLEKRLGKIKYLTLFVVSAFAGNAAVLAWAALTGGWNIAVVGASGAVLGLLGAWLALAGVGSENFRSILVFAAINVAYGFLNPGVSWQSHLGGFIGGFALAWVWKKLRRI